MKLTHYLKKMKAGSFNLLLCCLVLTGLTATKLQAQCSYGSPGIACAQAAPGTVGGVISCPNVTAGSVYRVTGMVSGGTYRISNCGGVWDTQITIFPAGGGASLGYNDDWGPGCLTAQSSIDFTPASGGDYDFLLSQYYCNASGTNIGTVTVTALSLPATGCTNSSMYPSAFNAPAAGTTYSISSCQYQSEYNQMNNVAAGSNFISTAGFSGTYISVRYGSYNGTLVGAGTTPFSWSATTAGTYYIHYNTNSSCGTAFSCMNTSIQHVVPACTNTSMYPSAFSAPAVGVTYSISTCQYQSEYNQMNGVVANSYFTSTAGFAGTWITVRFGTFNGPAVASGATPLNWSASAAGTYYIHYNTNSSCGTANSCMSSAITRLAPPTCTNTTMYPGSAFNAPLPGITYTINTCQFQSEYNQMNNVPASTPFISTASIAGTFITVRSGSYNGTAVASGTTPLSWTSAGAGSYYIHYNTNSSCGTAFNCMTTTIQNATAPPPTVLMSNGSTTTCNAYFFDTGGSAGNYVNNENLTHTFYPATAGSQIRIDFQNFVSESGWDFIRIYNGPSTGSPLIYGPSSGTLSIPQFTSTDPSGALTVSFTSDVSVTYSGWFAIVSCFTNPNCSGTPNPGNTTASLNPACAGQSFTLGLQNAIGGGSNPPAGYCNPIMYPSNGCNYIHSVESTGGVANFSNISGVYNGTGTTFFPSHMVSQNPGGSFTLTAQAQGYCNIIYYHIWIDWNQNGVFEATEKVYSANGVNSGNTATNFVISVPAGATPGASRIRVTGSGNSVNPTGPCDNLSSYYSENEDYVINVLGGAGSAGISYQWQSSPNGTTWTNITGATGGTLTTSQLVATWYQCIVTCAYGGSAISTPIQVTNQLCYCASNATSTFDEEIFNVTVGSLNNSSVCGVLAPGPGSLMNQYSNYRGYATVPNLTQATNYSVSVTVGECGSWAYSGSTAIFIDFNQNGIFEANERAFNSVYGPQQPSGTVSTGTMFIPNCATAGLTTMRVVYAEGYTAPPACGTYGYGETEDYNVNIVLASVVPPVATTASGPATATCNTSMSYSVAPGYFNTLQWQYATAPGGPYLDIVGATSANQTLFASGPATFYIRARFVGSGCVADAYSNEIQTVITSPVVNFTTSTPSTSICRGTAITITASSAGPYAWNTGATSQSITVTPLVNTTYTVSTGSGLCTGAGTITVDIIGGPIAAASVTPTTAVCPGEQVNLAANQILGVPGTGYTGSSIPYTTVSTAGTAVALGDDIYTSALPVGFNFTFFGITYTQAYVSSNGFISFAAGSGSGCCSGQFLPNSSAPNNLIALAWEDLNNTSNTITYNTIGSAPNRKFVVSYTNVAHYGGGGGPLTGQIILNETTNVIEIHTGSMVSDGGLHTQGIENATGTIAYEVPGRNSTSWSASNSSYMFTPNLGQTFTYSGPVTYSWVGSNGFTSSSMNTVDFPTVPTTYTLTVADDVCSSSSETSALIHPTPSVTSFTGSPFCENSAIEFFTDGSGPAAPPTAGSLVVTISGSGFLDETSWQLRNYANVVIASGSTYGFGTTNNINVTPAPSDYPVTFFIETQGSFNDNVANYSVYCNANSTMLVSGTATGGTSYTSSPYSCGGSAGGLQYNWTGPNGFTSTLEDPYIGSAQLTDNGTYTVVITDGNGCTESHSQTVIVNDNPEPYMALMSEVSCDGFNDGIVQIGVNGGTPFFSFYEASLGQQNYTGFYTGLYDGTYYFDVTDINGCFSPMPVEVVVTTAPNIAPVIVCPADVNMPNDPGSCGAIVNYVTPVGTDVCPVIGTLQLNGLASGVSFPIGTTVNTYEVTDVFNLTASCSFSVTVSDSEEPTILNCPSNFSSCNPITWTAPSITDNCLGLQVTSTHTPGTNFPFGTTTVTYTATDAYNNVSTCSFDVTRLEESVAADSITSNRDFNNICQGDDITLTINGGSLGEAAQWKWFSGSCGGTALPAFSGMSSITVAPTVTTTYYARAEGLCNTTGCISITVVVSTAAPNGVVITSVPAIGAVGQSGVVTANIVPGATFYRWTSILGHINAILFDGQTGPVETATNSVNVFFQLQLQNYQIRVVAGNACGRSNNASAHIRGTVPSATCLDGPVLACPSTTATYSVAACPIPGTSSYQWTIPSGDATITAGQGTNTISVTFGPGFTTAQVCVNGVSTFGLAGPTTCLTVSNSTEAPGAITGNDEPCQSGLENYTIAPVTGAVSYIWTTNIAGATASGTTVTGTVQFPSGSFSGQVCVQAVSGCGTSVASCYNVTSGAAGIPGPISGPVSGICGASNVNYALATNDANSYNWILPAGVTVVSGGSSNSVNVNFAPGLVGPQTITVEAFYNCGSATSSIVVDGAPATPTITPATICAGTDELYFASSAGADNYTWALTGAVYEECTNGNCSQYYVIWSATGGTMSVTASNSCGTSAPFNLSTNCRVSTTGNMDTKVYPNPTSGNLTIEFTSYAGGQYNLTVTDMAGRSFMTEDLKATSGLNQRMIDLGTANPGMYMLYLKDANGDISVHKITVE